MTDALVSAGYLSDADVDAAIAVLTDALTIAEAEEIEGEVVADIIEQEGLIAEAEDIAEQAAKEGDFETEAIAEDAIEEVVDAEALDAAVIETAEAIIDAAYLDAATAMVTAQLIDEANAEAVAAVIAGVREEE